MVLLALSLVIAGSGTTLLLRPSLVGQLDASLRSIAADPTLVLGGDASDYASKLDEAGKRKSRFVYLAKDITPAQWSQLKALELPGISSELRQKREYPQHTSVAPHIASPRPGRLVSPLGRASQWCGRPEHSRTLPSVQ